MSEHQHDWLDVTTAGERTKGMQLWVCKVCDADLTLRAKAPMATGKEESWKATSSS